MLVATSPALWSWVSGLVHLVHLVHSFTSFIRPLRQLGRLMESEACWMFEPIGTTSRFAAQEVLTGRFQSREVPPEANLLPRSLPTIRFVAQKPPLKQIAARKAPPYKQLWCPGGAPRRQASCQAPQ